jgi:hypothetical protein
LHKHFKNNDLRVVDYAWPMLKQLFSEIFNDDEWLLTMDILFTYPEKTNLIYFFTAAVVLEHRGQLLYMQGRKNLASFDFSRTRINVLDLMSKAMSYHDYYNQGFIQELGLSLFMKNQEMPNFGFIHSFPLPEGGYPVLIRYSKKHSMDIENNQKLSNTYKPVVGKVMEYENEDTDPEITPLNNSHKINRKLPLYSQATPFYSMQMSN